MIFRAYLMMAISFREIIVNCWAHAIDRFRSDLEMDG